MVRVKLFNFHTVQNLQMQWQTTCYKRWLWQCGDQPCRQRRCQLETILRKAWQRSTTTKTENEAFFVGKPKSWFSNVLERFLFLSAHMHQHLIYLPKRRFFKIDLCSEIKQISFFTTVSIFHQNMSVNCGYCFMYTSFTCKINAPNTLFFQNVSWELKWWRITLIPHNDYTCNIRIACQNVLGVCLPLKNGLHFYFLIKTNRNCSFLPCCDYI